MVNVPQFTTFTIHFSYLIYSIDSNYPTHLVLLQLSIWHTFTNVYFCDKAPKCGTKYGTLLPMYICASMCNEIANNMVNFHCTLMPQCAISRHSKCFASFHQAAPGTSLLGVAPVFLSCSNSVNHKSCYSEILNVVKSLMQALGL